jgi:hypothetical protein
MPSPHNLAEDTHAVRTQAMSPEDSPPGRPLRLRLHRPHHRIETIEVSEYDVRIRDVLSIDNDLIFLDEDEEPIDVDRTLAQVTTGRGKHHQHHDVHKHPCRWITAHVTYGDATETLQVAPSTRIETVRRRALDKFGLTPDVATTLVLRVSDTGTYVRHHDYVSDLVGQEPCRLDLNLIPSF